MTAHLIVGTAGHIDHGKTVLVKALTDVDTDRLPEEKRRGMTIELGFASLQLDDLHLGIVDVPGHERFIRNMLCGAMAIDVVMLIVAASESVKPQTREHLEILKHVGVDHGVVVLTKCDLAEPSWLEMVEEEVRALIEESPLSDAEIVRVSSLTGSGLPQLREALAAAARRAATSPRRQLAHAPFRLAIDRGFTAAGYGTIVTGSVASGRLRVGDEVAVEPRGLTARVRGLQSHGVAVEHVERGQRAAINLPGEPLEDVRRGDVLAEPGYLQASRRLLVQLRLAAPPRAATPHAAAPQPSLAQPAATQELASPPASYSAASSYSAAASPWNEAVPRTATRRRVPVRAHVGTAEIQATLRVLESTPKALSALSPEPVLAELELSEPAACVWGQPVVIRSQSPVATIGGGRVFDPNPRPLGRRPERTVRYLRRLASDNPAARVSALCYLNGTGELDARQLIRRTGATEPLEPLWETLVAEGQVEALELSSGRRQHLHVDVLERLMVRVEQLLAGHHERNPLQAVFSRSVLQPVFAAADPQWLSAVVQRMRAAERLTVTPTGIALPGYGPQLSKPQQRLYAEIIETHRRAGCAPPMIKEIAATAATRRTAVPKLVELAIAQGHLVRVCAEWCLHAEVESEMRRTLHRNLGQKPFAVKDLRELLHVSRKYLVPICEYLDRIGFTEREGNWRTIIGRRPRATEEMPH